MTAKQKFAINRFVVMAKQNKKVDLISTILDNPDCGAFVKINGQTYNLPCLAVAMTMDDDLFALDQYGDYRYFTREEQI